MLKLYLKLGIPVLLTCVVAAAGLGATYSVTWQRILEQDREAIAKSLRIVLPSAKTFEPMDPKKDKAVIAKAESAAASVSDTKLYGVYRALDADGRQVGWGVLVGPHGYGGPIKLAVGVDRNGKVTGVTITSMNETPGLGTKVITQKSFLPSFKGKDVSSGDDLIAKVDTIQGATKSSRGVKRGVQAAAVLYAKVLKNLGGASGK